MIRNGTITIAALTFAFAGIASASSQTTTVTHSFVCGDIHNQCVMKVAADGRVEWSYPVKMVHDVWSMPNGNILFASPVAGAAEVTPQKKVVWSYKAPGGMKLYAAQPLPNGDVMIAMEGNPSKIVEVGRDGTVRKTVTLQTKGAIRLGRKTDAGTYLVAARAQQAVQEYSADGKLIRSIKVPGNAYQALRLDNGNTLVACGDGHTIVEIDVQDRTVWKIDQNELPGVPLCFVAGIARLPNGNTMITNWGGHGGRLGKQAQIVEVTPDKKIVWQLYDNERFKSPVHAHFLDTNGKPFTKPINR